MIFHEILLHFDTIAAQRFWCDETGGVKHRSMLHHTKIAFLSKIGRLRAKSPLNLPIFEIFYWRHDAN
jgi:hypothetical protein